MSTYTVVREKYTPRKTFKKPLYVILGLGLVGLALYYFGTQFNSERVFEWLPLGCAASLGLFLLLGYVKSWPMPGSIAYWYKLEYVITENKSELQIYYSAHHQDRSMIKAMSLKGVTIIEIVSSSKKISGSYQSTTTDVAGTSPIGKTQPSGTYTTTQNYSYNQVKHILVLKPTEEQFEIPFSRILIEGVATELNKYLGQK